MAELKRTKWVVTVQVVKDIQFMVVGDNEDAAYDRAEQRISRGDISTDVRWRDSYIRDIKKLP